MIGLDSFGVSVGLCNKHREKMNPFKPSTPEAVLSYNTIKSIKSDAYLRFFTLLFLLYLSFIIKIL